FPKPNPRAFRRPGILSRGVCCVAFRTRECAAALRCARDHAGSDLDTQTERPCAAAPRGRGTTRRDRGAARSLRRPPAAPDAEPRARRQLIGECEYRSWLENNTVVRRGSTCASDSSDVGFTLRHFF